MVASRLNKPKHILIREKMAEEAEQEECRKRTELKYEEMLENGIVEMLEDLRKFKLSI